MNILFDLDGTLSDPLVGIANGLNHALVRMGLPQKRKEELGVFIGPSLSNAASVLFNTEDEKIISTAISYYRDYYTKTGYRENTLYEGIDELLNHLKSTGHPLFVATSKRTDIAHSVLEHFELSGYFTEIRGCDLNLSKVELVRDLMDDFSLSRSETVMVGDRSYDINAGKENGISSVGVLWGYGTLEELEKSGASHVVKSIEELVEYLDKTRQS